MIKRINSFGQAYNLFPDGPNSTKIMTQKKGIIVPFSIAEVEIMWANWQIGQQLIQYAFPLFTSAEREFLMTGMTPIRICNDYWI